MKKDKILGKLYYLLSLSILLAGCAKQPKVPSPSGMERAPRITSGTLHLFGMDPTQQQQIEVSRLKGKIFVLRQDVDDPDAPWEWIDCPLTVDYDLNRHPRRIHRMEIHSLTELQARLPMSQSTFSAGLARGSWYDFEYATVASFSPKRHFQLPRSHADCARATHYVSLLSVGAVAWSEVDQKSAHAGADVKVAEVKGHHDSGMSTEDIQGVIESCFNADAPLSEECKTPLAVAISPLADRFWCPEGNQQCEFVALSQINPMLCEGASPAAGCLPGGVQTTAPVAQATGDSCGPLYPEASGALGLFTGVVEDALNARRDYPQYELNDRDGFLFAGLLKNGKDFGLSFEAQAGDEYVAIALGDQDAKDLDLVVRGVVDKVDSSSDRQAKLDFTVPQTGTLKLHLVGSEINSESGAFVSMLVLRKGAASREMCSVRNTVKTALQRAELVADKVEAPRVGLFDAQWALYVGGLTEQANKLVSDSMMLPVGTTYAFAVGDSQVEDIDIALIAEDDSKEVDSEGDATPIVGMTRASEIRAAMLVQSAGKKPTVVAAVVLKAGDAEATTGPCETDDYAGVVAGTRVVLGRHQLHAGTSNWAESMTPYIGKSAQVTARLGTDKSGCEVVRVDVDGGEHVWRLRAMQIERGAIVPSEGAPISVGRWLMTKRDDMVVIWRADRGVAAEFWDGSNGWWNWMKDGKIFTVNSNGNSAEGSGFTRKPWTEGMSGSASASDSTYQSGAQKIEVASGALRVHTADGQVEFAQNGTVTFHTYDGKTKKM